jgi:hypothetical protein
MVPVMEGEEIEGVVGEQPAMAGDLVQAIEVQQETKTRYTKRYCTGKNRRCIT